MDNKEKMIATLKGQLGGAAMENARLTALAMRLRAALVSGDGRDAVLRESEFLASPEQAADARVIPVSGVQSERLLKDAEELAAIAGQLREVQHWAAQASVKVLGEIAKRLLAASSAASPEQAAPVVATCRDDDRCQYAIDHGAEGMAACPAGKCCMTPAPSAETISTHPAPAAGLTDWQHVSNEWADTASSALVWLMNVRDGISNPADAIANVKDSIAHCRALAAQQPAQAVAVPTNDEVYAAVCADRGKLNHYVSTNAVNDVMAAVRRLMSAATHEGKAGDAADGGRTDDWKLVMDEVERATRKFPTWPTDPLHAVAVLGEEFGELTKAVLQTTYEPHRVQDGELRTEAIQTAAMSLRFLASLGRYEFTRSVQHEQQAQQAGKAGA